MLFPKGNVQNDVVSRLSNIEVNKTTVNPKAKGD